MTPAEGLQMAFDLFEFALEALEARLRRERPGISDVEIEAQIAAWLAKRPGAEYGDAEGRPVPWPRHR